MSDVSRYIPTDFYCVWVEDTLRNVEWVGQLPRDGLDESDVDLPDWVYAIREYGDGKEERMYKACFGTLDEFMNAWLASKMSKASFNLAGLNIY